MGPRPPVGASGLTLFATPMTAVPRLDVATVAAITRTARLYARGAATSQIAAFVTYMS